MGRVLRVLVEFFDKEPIENVLGTCIFEPDMVVFVCDQRDVSFVKESAVYRLIRHRKLKTKARFYYVDATSIQEVYKALHAVVSDYPRCVFDFTGGTDLILLVAGAFCATNSLPGYYIDFETKTFLDVQGCSQLSDKFFVPTFTAEDILVLTGATIHGYGHFDPIGLNQQFENDTNAIWDIVQSNPKAWGVFVGWLQAHCSQGIPAGLHIGGRISVNNGQEGGKFNLSIAEHLYKAGIFTYFKISHGYAEITFKNQILKKSLQNQGIWLELFCYYEALKTKYFDDVRTSMVIDWDGVDGKHDTTKNEVDVFLVKGIVPIFISCKMSIPVPLALSEIKILSMKFGGMHSRTVLLTGGTLANEHKALLARAKDLGIHLLDLPVVQSGKLGEELVRIAQTDTVRGYF